MSDFTYRRIFFDGFAARDIAEPLLSFDDTYPAANLRAWMEERDFDIAGVRQNGALAGFVRRDELGEGPCGQWLHPFDPAVIVPGAEPLDHVIRRLEQQPRLLVQSFGGVGGIITHDDLQKPPVRMWLFGIITMIEMRMVEVIEKHYPDGSWQQAMSSGRLHMAHELMAERRRRGQMVTLMDCLQFADKADLVVRSAEARQEFKIPSRKRGEETVKNLQSLRNNLAHAQDIIQYDWPAVLTLAARIQESRSR